MASTVSRAGAACACPFAVPHGVSDARAPPRGSCKVATWRTGDPRHVLTRSTTLGSLGMFRGADPIGPVAPDEREPGEQGREEQRPHGPDGDPYARGRRLTVHRPEGEGAQDGRE